MNHSAISSFIWGTADLLRNNFKQHEYGDIILPFTVLRRLDVVLQPTKQAVLDEAAKPLPAAFADASGDGFKAMKNRRLEKASGQKFYNTSRFTMDELTSEPDDIKDNQIAYINGFSPEIVDIMEHFKIYDVINNLDKNNLLF